MDRFEISPDDCLILKAFRDTHSLREAAQVLDCDPAGLARRVQLISSQHGFLQKVNNRWQVSVRGLDLIAWAEASIESQKKVLAGKSHLRIAATTWFMEEVLIPGFEQRSKIPGLGSQSFAFSVPDKGFELALLDGSVDFAVLCHPPENPEIEHKQITEENWTLIAPLKWAKFFSAKKENFEAELRSKPFVRHSDINTDLFLPNLGGTITESGITVDNLTAVRAAVKAGLGWSIVPRPLVARLLVQKEILELPLSSPIRDRKVCLWWLRNRYDSRKLAGQLSSWVKKICD